MRSILDDPSRLNRLQTMNGLHVSSEGACQKYLDFRRAERELKDKLIRIISHKVDVCINRLNYKEKLKDYMRNKWDHNLKQLSDFDISVLKEINHCNGLETIQKKITKYL